METAAEGNRAITIIGTKQQRSILEDGIWFCRKSRRKENRSGDFQLASSEKNSWRPATWRKKRVAGREGIPWLKKGSDPEAKLV